MDEKLDQVKGLVIESRKLLLEVLAENSTTPPKYINSYTNKLFEASKLLFEVSIKLD